MAALSGMRLPLIWSTASHAIVLALLSIGRHPSLPEPAVKGGIEAVLGRFLSQLQAISLRRGGPTGWSFHCGIAAAGDA